MIWWEGTTGRPGLAQGSSGREANPITRVPRAPLHPGPSEPGAREGVMCYWGAGRFGGSELGWCG